jgi:hypothetical protein
MQKSSSAANEQGSREKLAWLAGIIDGEGSVNIKRISGNDKNGTRFVRAYSPCVHITNTDFPMVQEIALIMEAVGVSYYVNPTTKVPPRLAGRKECRFVMQVTVQGMKTCIKLLDMIIPYLVAKRREAELLREYSEKRYAELRFSRIPNPPGKSGSMTPPNTLAEIYYSLILAERAKQYDPSETTRRPSYFRMKPNCEIG